MEVAMPLDSYSLKELEIHFEKLKTLYEETYDANFSKYLLDLHRKDKFSSQLLLNLSDDLDLTLAVLQSSYEQYKEAIKDIAEEIDYQYPHLNEYNAQKIAQNYLNVNQDDDPNLILADINNAINYLIEESQRLIMNKGDECLNCYDQLEKYLGNQAPGLFKEVKESTDQNEAIETIQTNENLRLFSKQEIIEAIIHKEYLDKNFWREFDATVDRSSKDFISPSEITDSVDESTEAITKIRQMSISSTNSEEFHNHSFASLVRKSSIDEQEQYTPPSIDEVCKKLLAEGPKDALTILKEKSRNQDNISRELFRRNSISDDQGRC